MRPGGVTHAQPQGGHCSAAVCQPSIPAWGGAAAGRSCPPAHAPQHAWGHARMHQPHAHHARSSNNGRTAPLRTCDPLPRLHTVLRSDPCGGCPDRPRGSAVRGPPPTPSDLPPPTPWACYHGSLGSAGCHMPSAAHFLGCHRGRRCGHRARGGRTTAASQAPVHAPVSAQHDPDRTYNTAEWAHLTHLP